MRTGCQGRVGPGGQALRILDRDAAVHLEEGANLAVLDGAELVAALVARPGDPRGALVAYAEAVFPRSEAATAESAGSLDPCFGAGAPRTQVERMASYAR